MSDLVWLLILLGAGGGWFFIKRALERESADSGLLASEKEKNDVREALIALLWGHAFNALFSIPLLAYRSFDRETYVSIWLLTFLMTWLSFAGATQLLYAVPLYLQRRRRPQAARAVLTGGKLTAAVSALFWLVALARTPSLTIWSAGAGIGAMACALYLWSAAADLRALLRR